jgi:hypothetical protein
MQRGVGLANNGENTKRDAIAWVKWVGVGLFTKQGLRTRNLATKCTLVMSRKFLGSRFTETKTTLSVDIEIEDFNINGLLNGAIHISGFRGEDGRIVELNTVSVVDTLLSYDRIVRMF